MFFGWEGVGLASYLLINFWFTRLQASKASLKAMLVNRVGDFGLALGILAIFSVFKTLDFSTVFACAPHLAGTKFIFCNFEFVKWLSPKDLLHLKISNTSPWYFLLFHQRTIC